MKGEAMAAQVSTKRLLQCTQQGRSYLRHLRCRSGRHSAAPQSYGGLRNSATVITRPITTTVVRTNSRPRRWARRAPAYPPAIKAAALIKAPFQRIDPVMVKETAAPQLM